MNTYAMNAQIQARCTMCVHACESTLTRRVQRLDVDPSGLPASQHGVLGWTPGTRVDPSRATSVSAGGRVRCAAPIVRQPLVGTAYDVAYVSYWAVAEGSCCQAGGATCEGWGEELGWGVNWGMGGRRPSTLFLSRGEGWGGAGLGQALQAAGGGSMLGGAVLVEWSGGQGSLVRHPCLALLLSLLSSLILVTSHTLDCSRNR